MPSRADRFERLALSSRTKLVDIASFVSEFNTTLCASQVKREFLDFGIRYKLLPPSSQLEDLTAQRLVGVAVGVTALALASQKRRSQPTVVDFGESFTLVREHLRRFSDSSLANRLSTAMDQQTARDVYRLYQREQKQQQPFLQRTPPQEFFRPTIEYIPPVDRESSTRRHLSIFWHCFARANREEDLGIAVDIFNAQATRNGFIQPEHQGDKVVLRVADIGDIAVFLAARWYAAQNGRVEPQKTDYQRGLTYVRQQITQYSMIVEQDARPVELPLHPNHRQFLLKFKPTRQTGFTEQLALYLSEQDPQQYYAQRHQALDNYAFRSMEERVRQVLLENYRVRRMRKYREDATFLHGETMTSLVGFLYEAEYPTASACIASVTRNHQVLPADFDISQATTADLVDFSVFMLARRHAAEDGRLTPDGQHFQQAVQELERVLDAKPDVFPGKEQAYQQMHKRLARVKIYANVRSVVAALPNLFDAAGEDGHQEIPRSETFNIFTIVIRPVRHLFEYLVQTIERKVLVRLIGRLDSMVLQPSLISKALMETAREQARFDPPQRQYSLPRLLHDGTTYDLGLWLHHSVLCLSSEIAAQRRKKDPSRADVEKSVRLIQDTLVSMRDDVDAWDKLGRAGQRNWVALYACVCTETEFRDLYTGITTGNRGRRLDFSNLQALQAEQFFDDPYENSTGASLRPYHTLYTGNDVLHFPAVLFELQKVWMRSFRASRYSSQSQARKYEPTVGAFLERVKEIREELQHKGARVAVIQEQGSSHLHAFAWMYNLDQMEAKKRAGIQILPGHNNFCRDLRITEDQMAYLSMVGVDPIAQGSGFGGSMVEVLLVDSLIGTGVIEGSYNAVIARTINPAAWNTLYNTLIEARLAGHTIILPVLLGYYIDTDANAFRLIFGWVSDRNVDAVQQMLREEFQQWQQDGFLGPLLEAKLATMAYFAYLRGIGEATQTRHLQGLPEQVRTWGLPEQQDLVLHAAWTNMLTICFNLGFQHGANGGEQLAELMKRLDHKFDRDNQE